MKRLVFLLAAIFFLFPCCSSGPYRATGPEPGEKNPEDTETVIYTSEELPDLLKILAQKAERKPDGRLAVYANLQNMENEELHILIQTDFKDQDGISTGDTTNWEHILIPGYSTRTYKQISLNNRAYKYTIRVKLAEE